MNKRLFIFTFAAFFLLNNIAFAQVKAKFDSAETTANKLVAYNENHYESHKIRLHNFNSSVVRIKSKLFGRGYQKRKIITLRSGKTIEKLFFKDHNNRIKALYMNDSLVKMRWTQRTHIPNARPSIATRIKFVRHKVLYIKIFDGSKVESQSNYISKKYYIYK
jgi:hypothetical protein